MDPEFVKQFWASQAAVGLVVTHLSVGGWDCHVDGMKLAPSADQIPYYRDRGDIFTRPPGKKWGVVEVKQITKNFTGREDWPFEERFIVDGVSTLDAKKHPLRGYICLSKDFRSYGWCPANTRDLWYARNINTRYKYSKPFYFCPTDLVTFGKINPSIIEALTPPTK